MNKRNSKSSLFLIELIITILFFSLGSAVCVEAFVKAHLISKHAKDVSFASSQASSAASVMKYTDGSFSDFLNYYLDAAQKDTEFLVYYDKKRQPSAKKNSEYTMYVSPTIKDSMKYIEIRVDDSKKKELYSLNIHFPISGKEAADES